MKIYDYEDRNDTVYNIIRKEEKSRNYELICEYTIAALITSAILALLLLALGAGKEKADEEVLAIKAKEGGVTWST